MYESCAKGGENHIVTLPESALIIPHGQRNRGGTRITVMLNVHHHLLHRQLKSLGYCLDDTHVCLMGNHPLDVVLIQPLRSAISTQSLLMFVTA